ncbi:MAG TPA: glycosyl hydrolase, partial [Bacteroidales bacterium]|nr:glycosyl hydrolase [Bacteroidales bacterium]
EYPKLMAVTACNGAGERLLLTPEVDSAGILNWRPDNGKWTVYAAFEGKTGQHVKRAAPGGEGLVMDHFSKEATNHYLARFDSAFDHKNTGVRAFFNDSYEVYNADFSPGLFDTFLKNRGYDARLYMKELTSNAGNDTVKRIQADYRLTLSGMLLNNFTRTWSSWIHSEGAKSRNQAHGSPGNLLDLYAAVDIPECETFGSSHFSFPGMHKYTNDTVNAAPDPFMMKFAVSAADVTGKKLISCETFTWLGEHFKVPLSECKPEVDKVFLSGVNHVFYHGTTYSPANAAWPGWLFYASVNFSPSNTFWPHIKGLNSYITRCQSVLQAGHPDNDILLYWPAHDAWHRTGKLDFQLSVHNAGEWLKPTAFYRLAESLSDQGYTVDFVSDNMIDSTQVEKGLIKVRRNAPAYKVIVVPETRHMPVSTLEHLLELANQGAVVIFQKLPATVPGFGNMASRTQAFKQALDRLPPGMKDRSLTFGDGKILVTGNVESVLSESNVEAEPLVETGLKFTRRVIDGDRWYFVVNHTAKPVRKMVPLNVNANSVWLLDPLNGRTGYAEFSKRKGKVDVKLELNPGESLFIHTSGRKPGNNKPWEYTSDKGEALKIEGPWKLTFVSGGPALPAERELDSLVSWTTLNDSVARWFSGTAEYSTAFTLDSLRTDNYMLDLGDVRESARVWINGKDAGIAWSIPFRLQIGEFLHKGENTIKIEVANLMANRIIYMDRHGIPWRNFHEINFVNLEYKPFDASGGKWMPSGLRGPVKIVPVYSQE